MHEGDGPQTRVKTARLNRGWSIERLARETGLSRDTIAGIERGLQSPRVETAVKIAQALGVTLTDLFEDAA